jgi:hypothetical protein
VRRRLPKEEIVTMEDLGIKPVRIGDWDLDL